MSRRTFWLMATLILLVAACLRLWDLHAYPPGPHYDEAANVLIARSIAFGGARYFPIVPGYQGREVLYYDLSAPFFWFISDGRLALQLVNVFGNLLTIAATMALGRAMFPGRRGQIVGLTAGALLALSFPQILLARQAFRAPTLPLMQALALVCLWRGLRRRRSLWLAVGGVFAGAALYTYMASRLFPLWLLMAGLLLIVLDQGRRRLRLRQGVVFFGALALTAAPMAVYALQSPDIFLGRLYEVTRPGESITLAESILRHLRMFFIQGDPLLRYNLPGRPYFTWPEGILLLIGLGIAGWRLLHVGRAITRVAYGLLLLAPLMILPSVISVGSFPPNHMRSIAMVPLIFLLLGVGVEGVVTFADRVIVGAQHAAPLRRIAPILATLVFLLASVWVANVYFGWAARADLFYETDADLAAAAAWLPQHRGEDTRVYIAGQHVEHPTVLIANLPDVIWLGTNTLFRPAPGAEGIAIFPRSAPPPESWAAWLAPAAMDGIPLGPDARPAFDAYRLTAAMPLPDSDPPPEPVRNGLLTLLGVRANPIFPGASGEVIVTWQVDQTPPYPDLTPILQVEDDLGTVLARTDAPYVETDHWRTSEVLMQRLSVSIPVGIPPGNYPLRMTWVARASNQYRSFMDDAGLQVGIWAQIGEVQVLPPVTFPDPDSLSIAQRSAAEIAPGVRLLGWSDYAESRRPGETLALTLYWQGEGDSERSDPMLEVHLSNDAGDDVLLGRGQPTRGHYPPGRWRDGEVVVDHVRWSVPRETPGGTYTLSLRAGDSVVDLGALDIAGIPRLFDPPPVDTVLQTGLGDSLQLYGDSLHAEGSTLKIDLVWQAQAAVATDYTVFVHVVDDAGNIVAQQDRMPVDGTYPTTLWESGEFVADSYTFADLPAGHYDVRVGLYDQADGQRLPLTDRPQTDSIDLGQIEITPAS